MSQAWASLSKASMLLSICFIMSACNGSYTAFEDDRDFNTDVKTVDIEMENAEEITLNVLQSAYTAHFRSALYEFLDVSDLPSPTENAVYDSVSKTYSVMMECVFDGNVSGSVKYTFTRPADEAHEVGDKISLIFDQCDRGNAVYNGSLTGRYTQIKGLNKTFDITATETCLANVLDELNLQNSQVIQVSGDDLKFRIVADTLEVDVVDYEFTELNGSTSRRDIVLDTVIIDKDEKAVLVNMLLDKPDNAVTSVDGDQIYSVTELTQTKHACQNYERTLSVTLNDFSTLKGDLETILKGTVTLFEAQENPARINQELVNSNFQTIVVQGNAEHQYNMKNYRVQKALNLGNDSYAYLFEGFISSDALNGMLQLTNAGKLFGNIADEYPYTGSLEIKGRGLERIQMQVDFQNLGFQVDFNGDSTGNGFSDFDGSISSRWSDLYAREFKF